LTFLKSIVLCLVLANVGYFLWTRGIAETAEAPAPTKPLATLKLASEAARAPSVAANAATGTGANPAPGAGASNGVAGTAANDAATGTAGGAANASASISGGAANAVAASGASNGTAGAGPEVSRAEAAGGSAAPLTDARRCMSVGPFRDVSEAAHAASTLRGGGYDPRQRVAEGEVWAGIWVYLPLQPSRAGEDQMLAKLKSGGIDDALEMPGPAEGSVISLGLYSEPKRAQARVAQAHALGFNPRMTDRKRTGNVYWIDVDLKPTDSSLNPADLQGEAGRIVRLEVRDCPSASGAPP
jgi:hypothetical protein